MNGNQNDNNGKSVIAAGLTGLLIGAVGTAAIALSDRDTRKKATKKAGELKNNLQKWSDQTLTDIKRKKEGSKEELKNAIDESSDKAEKKL